MLVQVRQAHIGRGMRLVPTECPIAQALYDQCGADTIVKVHASRVSLKKGEASALLYDLPFEARQFIACFDGAHPVKPLTFVMEVIEEVRGTPTQKGDV